MKLLVLVGSAAFFLVSLLVGLRLVALWRRTRQLPELLIGVGVLGIGPLGYGFALVGMIAAAWNAWLAQVLLGIALLASGIGSFSKFLFNWRVYHPESAAARALVTTAALVFLGSYAVELSRGAFSDPNAGSPRYVVFFGLQVGCLLWGSVEALRYWRLMRRRAAVGLGDPEVTNRFLLWGIGAGAAGVGTALGIGAQVILATPATQLPWVMLITSLHGLTAAVAVGLAFLPPAAYLRFIRSRARPAKA